MLSQIAEIETATSAAAIGRIESLAFGANGIVTAFAAEGTLSLVTEVGGTRTLRDIATPSVTAEPALASDPAGGFLVGWIAGGQPMVQRFDAAGAPSGEAVAVAIEGDSALSDLSLAVLTDGRVVAAGTQDSRAVHVTLGADLVAEGAPLRSAPDPEREGASQTGNSVTALSDGGFAIGWSVRAFGEGEFDNSFFGAYAQGFAADGTARGAEATFGRSTFEVDGPASSNPIIQGDSDGGYVVAYRGVFGNFQVTFIDADGVARGGDFQIEGESLEPSTAFDVAVLDDGRAAVAWFRPERFDPETMEFVVDPSIVTVVLGPDDTRMPDADVVLARGSDLGDVAVVRDGATGGIRLQYVEPQEGGGVALRSMPTAERDQIATPFDDTLTGGAENDTLGGFDGDDRIVGSEGDDVLTGGQGNDSLAGGPGADTADGGAGDDTLRGGPGRDSLFGGLGSDLMTDNGDTADTLNGWAGDDTLDGGAGEDLLIGGQGSDVFFVDNVWDRVAESRTWAGSDTVISSVNFRMGRKHIEDLELTGEARLGAGNGLRNTITGNDADNVLDGGKNVDTLIGGAGNDRYLIRAPGDNAVETADGGIDTVLAFRAHALDANIENLFLQTLRNDAGQGIAGVNGIGNDLDNLIVGNPFDNVITGREGNDTLRGQAGADTFVFDRARGDGNVDTIVDFNTNEADEGDSLRLLQRRFGDVEQGQLAQDQFVTGSEALDANDRFLFDVQTLYFDPDGDGAAATQAVAVFQRGAMVTHEDIFIF